MKGYKYNNGKVNVKISTALQQTALEQQNLYVKVPWTKHFGPIPVDLQLFQRVLSILGGIGLFKSMLRVP